ncbi:MAG: hypothetical protein RR931_02215 [Mucinivorans sp.]
MLYILGFVVLLLLQDLVVSRVAMGGYVAVYVYIMFIMLLPLNIKGWQILSISFLCGAFMDILSGTGGVNAVVCTFLGFVRPTISTMIFGADVTQTSDVPSSYKFGPQKFWLYISLMTICFTVPFFLLESMGSYSLGFTSLKILLSTFVSVVLIYFCHLLLSRRVI